MPTTLYDLPEIEYLDGHAHAKVSARLTHGRVQLAIAGALMNAAGSRGVVATEVRFNPGALDGSKTELVPDVAFIAAERLGSLTVADREKPPFSPDIAVEVRSPSDDLRYLRRKIARYLATGSVLVLDVDPAQRCIVAYAADGISTFSAGDTFVHSAVPWLRFAIDSIMTLR